MIPSTKIRIGYFADGPWAHHAFQSLIRDAYIEIAFICVRYDSADQVLIEYAAAYNIDLLKHSNINSQDFLAKVKKYHCDLFVSMSFNQIFRSQIIGMPRLKTINCHAGKLPFYRGRNILNWALINDEKEFGITVHYMDEGIDTGDIILQRVYPITDADDYQTLLQLSHVECASCLYDAIHSVIKGEAKRIHQTDIHPVGFYCAQRKAGDEIINWNQNSRELFNFVRAICKPGPMATTRLNGQEIKINKAEMIADAPLYKGNPGQVVFRAKDFFVVKTTDTTLKITQWESPVAIRMGDKLGESKPCQ
jgi:methionyl-tRNA formyltransferase